MMWAKAAVAGGLLVVLAMLAIGTEAQLTTSVMREIQDCGPSISASWLVSGTPDQTQPGSAATDDERRVAAACGPVVREARVPILTVMGLGGLLTLVGRSAIRTREEVVPRAVAPAHV